MAIVSSLSAPRTTPQVGHVGVGATGAAVTARRREHGKEQQGHDDHRSRQHEKALRSILFELLALNIWPRFTLFRLLKQLPEACSKSRGLGFFNFNWPLGLQLRVSTFRFFLRPIDSGC